MHEVELNRAGLLDLVTSFDIKYDGDGDGEFILMFIQSLKKELLMIKRKR
jgi:hypothetical protein